MLYLDYSREAGEWIPNQFGGRENLEAVEFLQQLEHARRTADVAGTITVAEESTAWPARQPVRSTSGGLGFTYKWNMGWMHDMLEYIKQDPVHRRWHHNQVTFSMLYAFTENFVLPFSHDEVVHGKGSMLDKMPGDLVAEARDAARALRLMFAHPGQEADVHGLRVRPVARVESRHAASTGTCSRCANTRDCAAWCGI